MKRYGLILGGMLLALCIAANSASAGRFALGAYGGGQWPIVQDDADPGGLFGIKGKVALTPLIELEPNITWIKNGDTETESGDTRPAPDVTSYALNGNLKLGKIFRFTAGIGWSSVDFEITDAENKFTFNTGIALEIPVGPVNLDVSPRLLIINTESGASRKHMLVMAGLNYWF